ncbi:pentapeptide repeat-containing protein [Nesterenkonia sp. Act20]|uniref:pentapeptide repeat-containing protein n=1 Tax=Nesterenkonia sp. Act20 TaxID=1483432 RepID=UPI001C4730F6|nr:pentapeptide repeat-containing protein [Nesterenkonia sp. Act20]
MTQVQGPRLREQRHLDLAAGDETELRQTAQADRIILEDADLSAADLSGGRLTECVLRSVTMGDADLTAASVVESSWERVNSAHLKAPRSTWRDVTLQDSRLGVAELHDAGISGLVVRGCKLDLVNLRNAVLADVHFEDCAIGELDISGARANRVRFTGCTVGTLEARQARLKDVDLRGAQLHRLVGLAGLKGAAISSEQLLDLAPSLAAHLGLVVDPS